MYERIINDLNGLLSQELSKDDFELKNQLRALEMRRSELLIVVSESNRRLQLERDRLRMPKDKDYTDFDRQTMLNAAVADFQYEYDVLKGLSELVEQRLSLGYCLLAPTGVVTASDIA